MSSHTEKGGERERERERRGGGLVRQPKWETRRVEGFCTGTCPEAFLWSFNLLWRASPLHRGQKEDCVAT